MNKFESTSILNQVKQHYSSIFQEGSKLIIGVSGGPDSMALLYMLHKLSIPLLAVHINYSKRGLESDTDQKLVEDMCSMWGIECCSVKLNPDEVVRNFQEWARDQRYQVFRDLSAEMGAFGIAVAHHQGDQLETILFKILRGGGVSSWRGLQIWDGELFRPLLDLSKSEILDFCEVESVPFRIDESNQNDEFTRNALRNSVFPVFDDFIPGWKSNLLGVASKANIADEAFDFVLQSITDEHGLIVTGLNRFSNQLAGELVRRYVVNGINSTPSKGILNETLDLLGSETGKTVRLNEFYSITRDRKHLILSGIEKELVGKHIFDSDTIIKGIEFGSWSALIQEKQNGLLNLDANEIKWPITIRTWEYGDNFEPIGLGGTQKVSDHLTNRKISASKKEDSLILIDSGGTICAILYPVAAVNGEFGCISERVKLTESTKHVLSIFK